MRYYEVLVGDLQYHGTSALTYASESETAVGSIVRIALRSRSVLGIVVREVPEPSFDAKPISAVAPFPPLPSQALELISWLHQYYPAPFGAIVRQFLPAITTFPKKNGNYHILSTNRPLSKPPFNRETTLSPSEKVESGGDVDIATPTSASAFVAGEIGDLAGDMFGKSSNNQTKSIIQNSKSLTQPPLTNEQQQAIASIRPSGYHLLHGVTGSGKTRIYLELARRTVDEGKSAIILTPEIGLTAQLTKPFEQAFPGQVYVLHSRLTAGQRRDIWYRILSETEPVMVIGPRSALFAPVRKLGLVVIDESHDQAYKSETAPKLRAERVAAKLAQLHNACLVSGSATPNSEEYYVAAAKHRPIITLSSLAIKQDTVSIVRTVDLRDRSLSSRSPICSTPLIEAIHLALERHEQTLLFLNRRGTAGAILCAGCGWQALCSHCDLALTYHGDSHHMRCHVCGRTWPLSSVCPECGHSDILLKTIGTKAVIDEVKRLFPGAKTARFDTDTSKAEQLESQLEDLREGNVDIIVGTQMITKGLDLPKLSVVGVLNADSSLLIPDYTANERTYQLLTQVIGRGGRGHRASTTIIQTYNPTHPVLEAALRKDWAAFYEREIAERKAFRFPPYVYLLKLSCLRARSSSAEKAAMTCKEQIEKRHPRLKVDGPTPAFHPRESGKYKWQLIVKSPSRQLLLDVISTLPSGWTHDVDPVNLL
ncbi:primosomal protein N' [Candidatus Saccharibacteria bacterium]|nr:primosomal protein N' [Candidatus Saccharibacteria bacterium]